MLLTQYLILLYDTKYSERGNNMKNQIGKKNMIFGFAYFITTLILGLYLASEAEEAMPGWRKIHYSSY